MDFYVKDVLLFILILSKLLLEFFLIFCCYFSFFFLLTLTHVPYYSSACRTTCSGSTLIKPGQGIMCGSQNLQISSSKLTKYPLYAAYIFTKKQILSIKTISKAAKRQCHPLFSINVQHFTLFHIFIIPDSSFAA